MAAYRRVYDCVTVLWADCVWPGTAPGPMFVYEYGLLQPLAGDMISHGDDGIACELISFAVAAR